MAPDTDVPLVNQDSDPVSSSQSEPQLSDPGESRESRESGESGDRKGRIPVRKLPDGRYALTVMGQERVLTEEELFQKALLAEGAYSKFEEAAKLRKEWEQEKAQIEEGLVMLQDLLKKAILEGDIESTQEILKFAGISEMEAEKLLRNANMTAERMEQKDTNADLRKAQMTLDEIPLEKLPPEVQKLAKILGTEEGARMLARLYESQKEEDRNRVYRELWTAVEADEKLGKIVKKGGPRAEKLREFAQELIAGRILRGEQYGPELLASVVRQLRSLAEEFGTGSSETPIPNLGMGPGISHLVSQTDEAPKREPINSPKFEESIGRRLIHKLATMAGNS